MKDEFLVRSFLSMIAELKTQFYAIQFASDVEKTKEETWKKWKAKLDQTKDVIKDKDTALEYLTLVDFELYHFSFFLEKIYPDEFKDYP